MTYCSNDLEILNLIWTGVNLAGDGGCDPFTERERILMNDLLYRIERDIKHELEGK